MSTFHLSTFNNLMDISSSYYFFSRVIGVCKLVVLAVNFHVLLLAGVK